MDSLTLIESVRKPEYTGENRCVPCTAVNAVIALVTTAALSVISPVLGVAFLVVAAAAIYLRGYLVPGTPALTKQYFPDWLLAKFDTHPRSRTEAQAAPAESAPGQPETDAADAEPLDAERVLREAGAIVDDADGLDIALEPAFERSWFERMDRMDDTATDVTELAELLDVEADRLTVERHGDAFVAYLDDRWIGQWESRAAFVADMAGARELESRYADWPDLPLAHRSEVLGGLRICLERCPACGGEVVIHQDVVESCCRSHDVIAATCNACDARLFEADYDEEAFETAAA